MKRLLICCAAMAFWAVDQTELAAQSGARTGSYQTILAQAGVPGYDQPGSYGNGYANNYGAQQSQGYPGISAGYQQPGNVGAPVANVVPQPAPVSSGCNSCDGGAPMIGGQGGCASGGCGSASGCGGYDGYASAGQGYVDGQVYAPGRGFGGGNLAGSCGSSRNYFMGLRGLIFDRDFEDDVFLTRNPAGDRLLSTDADTGTLAGLEFFLGSRSSNGNGFEARYWGLFADEAVATLNGASHQTYITGLQDLIWPTTGEDLQTVFDRGTTNTITRDNEIHNVELSMLRRGGCFTTRRGRSGNFELLSGFRWFEFDEEFRWNVTSAAAPLNLDFDTEVGNTLLGFQMGGRSTICLGQRMSLIASTKGGIYNNRARVSQSIVDENGVYATVNGTDYNYDDAKNDVSFLGEIDLGVAFATSQCSRLVTGYRAIGVSGVALAPNQYSNFNTTAAIRDVQSNGSLLLHGAYFGLEFCR